MIRSLLSGLVLACLATAAHAAFDVDQLMANLAQHKGGRAKFVEKRYLAVLDRPLVATGEMTYTAPDRLEKRTLTPQPETMLLDKDTLNLERGTRRYSINLASRPEALAFVDSIRGTLAGDRAALERSYGLHLAGTPERWTLTLLPSDTRIAALLQRIVVSGSRDRIRSIEYVQADGDRSLLTLEPIAGR
jgi:outer membrane lipoprotein-sorting protein